MKVVKVVQTGEVAKAVKTGHECSVLYFAEEDVMGAVKVAGNAYITKGPPWARRFGGLKLGRLAYPPGTLPPQLVPHLFTNEPRQCATETAKLSGAGRVMAMNVCIARLKGRGRR